MSIPKLRRSALSFSAMCLLASSSLALQSRGASAEQERLRKEREYQQELAKRRAEEAKMRADGGGAVAAQPSAEHFQRLLQLATEYEAKGQRELALRTFNRALEAKPADLPLSEEAQLLRLKLVAHRQVVSLTILSDGKTWVSVERSIAPKQAQSFTVDLSPGEWVVLGRRRGFQDVRIPLVVNAGVPQPPLRVACTEPL